MSMTNDLPILQCLRCRIIRNIWIREASGDEVVDFDLNIERLVCRKVCTRRRVDDDRRDHVGLGGDFAHDDAVAGTGTDLLTVCELLPLAEVDEVGGIGLRA